MPTKLKDSFDPIIVRLRALARESPDLKEAAQIYEVILPLLRDADLRAGTVSLTPEQVRTKMEQGMPLLPDIELDVVAVRELMLKLARAVETVTRKNQPHSLRMPWLQASDETDTAAGRIRYAIEEHKLDICALLPHIVSGESNSVISAAERLQLDPALVWTLAQSAVKPALRACCRQLAPLAKGLPWDKGICFVCGAVATLGELQENDQVKHLRCGSCGADWQFPRLKCMYCGNEDHKTQQCLYSETQREKMRVEACDKCHGYLKVISSFSPTPPEMLPVEDLATLHLDYIARERGYARVLVQ